MANHIKWHRLSRNSNPAQYALMPQAIWKKCSIKSIAISGRTVDVFATRGWPNGFQEDVHRRIGAEAPKKQKGHGHKKPKKPKWARHKRPEAPRSVNFLQGPRHRIVSIVKEGLDLTRTSFGNLVPEKIDLVASSNGLFSLLAPEIFSFLSKFFVKWLSYFLVVGQFKVLLKFWQNSVPKKFFLVLAWIVGFLKKVRLLVRYLTLT